MNIQYYAINFGADPEFFFKENGKVIGAEKVLPKGGLKRKELQYKLDAQDKRIPVPGNPYSYEVEEKETGNPYVIIDGVQAEFNVVPNHCRQSFSTNLATCFKKVFEEIKGKGITTSFAQTVEVTKDEMNSLSPEAQQFGCAPSENAYARTKVTITDASKYLSRSAGGHIHIGHMDNIIQAVLANTDLTVPILDIVVGNTMVLIDRDPGNVERRKNYGRAGEFRLPTHGLEYRTLSNFWLRSYQTMSLVLGMVRLAVCIAADAKASKKLLSLVDPKDIARAINENDAELAQQNFDKVKAFLQGIAFSKGETNPLEGSRLTQFEYFASKGLDYWFKEDVMKHWINHSYTASNGWEGFLALVVDKNMVASQQTLVEKVKSFVNA